MPPPSSFLLLLYVQIRFHVIEARKLPGGNLKPVVKVQCGAVVKGTSVQKGTNNPIFDEVIAKWLLHSSSFTLLYIMFTPQ